jgi:endonuclease/exonuclease/phosphatase (EEP) superfamily protein YafD
MRAPVKVGLLVAVAVVLLASACSGDDTSEPRPQAATSETTASTTATTIESTTTTIPADERAEVAVVRLLRLRNQAFSAPDPALADGYLAPECACYQQERTSLTNLQMQGWHWASPMFEVLGVKVAEASKPDLVTLTVVTRRPPERVVDSSGALAKPEGPGEEATGYSYLLVRKDGAWRIGDNFKLDLSPEAIQQIMAAGVPS